MSHRRIRSRLCDLIFLCLVLFAGHSYAQLLAEDLEPITITKIAEYSATESGRMDDLLRRAGYSNTMPDGDWMQLSDSEKLSIATAEAFAVSTENAWTFLAYVRNALIKDVPSFERRRCHRNL